MNKINKFILSGKGYLFNAGVWALIAGVSIITGNITMPLALAYFMIIVCEFDLYCKSKIIDSQGEMLEKFVRTIDNSL